MYVGPLCFVALAVIGFAYARLAGERIGMLRPMLNLASAWCLFFAGLIYKEPALLACGIVGVSSEEIEAFRRRFLRACGIAGLNLSDVAIAFYGFRKNLTPDHARLNHELAEGTIKSVHLDKLPPAWHLAWMELTAEEKQLEIVTADTLRRASRVALLAPKPEPAYMNVGGVCQLAAS